MNRGAGNTTLSMQQIKQCSKTYRFKVGNMIAQIERWLAMTILGLIAKVHVGRPQFGSAK